MSYTLVKNLRIKKDTGVITGEFADSSLTDYNGKHCYKYIEDFYNNEERTRTPIQKYARFIYDVITGNLQGSLGKYKKLKFKNYFKDVDYYRHYKDVDPYVLTYNKYQKYIEEILNEKPEYIIKVGEDIYLSKLNKLSFQITNDKNKIKLFGKSDFIKIKDNISHTIAINVNSDEKIHLDDYERKNIPSEIECYYDLKVANGYDFNYIVSEILSINSIISVLSDKKVNLNEVKDVFNERINKLLN